MGTKQSAPNKCVIKPDDKKKDTVEILSDKFRAILRKMEDEEYENADEEVGEIFCLMNEMLVEFETNADYDHTSEVLRNLKVIFNRLPPKNIASTSHT